MRTTPKFRIGQIILTFALAIVALFATPYIFSDNVYATQETCPQTGDWVKIDPVDAQSYNYTAPEGKVVVETCYKAGTTVVYNTIDPGQSSVTVVSDVDNPTGNAKQDISHASFRLADAPKEEEERPFVRITYICQADAAGIVEGYGLSVNPGDHIWRIRHESGPATSFSTNFLSDVYGYIEVGQTLYFVTSQSANGVKVITSPLENLYQGTASVSGAICEVPEEPKEGDLSLFGECQNDGMIKWTVTNTTGETIQFSWLAANGENGNSEVSGNDSASFSSTSEGYNLTVSYVLNDQAMEIGNSVELCKDPEEPKTSADPAPDVPAGGSGPALIATVAPFVLGASGLGTAFLLALKGKKAKKNG